MRLAIPGVRCNAHSSGDVVQVITAAMAPWGDADTHQDRRRPPIVVAEREGQHDLAR
jgi:hypothetical protein